MTTMVNGECVIPYILLYKIKILGVLKILGHLAQIIIKCIIKDGIGWQNT